jgi:hypothetical protein
MGGVVPTAGRPTLWRFPVKKSVLTAIAATTVASAVLATASIASAGTSPGDGQKTLTEHQRQLLSVNDPAYTGQGTVRVSGSDRYETAVALSRTTWSPGATGAVYLAVGTRFPDGVAAATSAALSELGPILYTETDTLPEVTRAEIERLQPCLIFVVGDEASVSPAVAAAADVYTNPGRCFD